MRVKDLDPVLQETLRDLMKRSGLKPVLISEAPVIEIQNLIDWRLATNEGRLKYAELMMPKGTIIESVYGTKCTIQFDFIIQLDSIYAGSTNESVCVYSNPVNKWAEIVSRPDEKEETMEKINNYFENTNPEQLKKDWEETKEPEFQPGEMVEVRDDSNNVWSKRKYAFSVNGKHWTSVPENETIAMTWDEIRKIQPDPEKEIRKRAQVILSKHNLQGLDPSTNVTFQIGMIESMLIEALKTEVK